MNSMVQRWSTVYIDDSQTSLHIAGLGRPSLFRTIVPRRKTVLWNERTHVIAGRPADLIDDQMTSLKFVVLLKFLFFKFRESLLCFHHWSVPLTSHLTLRSWSFITVPNCSLLKLVICSTSSWMKNHLSSFLNQVKNEPTANFHTSPMGQF